MRIIGCRRWLLCMLSAGMLTGTALQAQNRLTTAVQQELLTHQATNYSLFEKSARQDAAIDKELGNVVYLKLNKNALSLLKNANGPLISFSLPLREGTETLTLHNYNILDEGFKVYAMGSDGQKKEVSVPLGVFYRGILDGQANSIAAFTFTDGEVAAVFSTPEGGNYNLVLNYNDPGTDRDNYILFREADAINPHPARCAVTEEMRLPGRDQQTAARGTYSSCHKLRVSMRGDYKLYQKKNSNMTNSVNYLTSLFNVIAALYDNEGIVAVMSEAVVSNAPDGYTYGGSDEVLQHFGEVTQSNFVGDIAHLVSGYAQNNFPPLGGLAWLDVLCQTPTQFSNGTWYGPFSIADNYILNNIPNLPMYSWDVEASTHEIGHNIGSPHTQSCTWPGGPIDNCVAVEDGTCAPGPNPAASGGTIMSYCHLTAAGINFALGFGPLPGNLIRQNMNSSPCLTSFQPLKTLTTDTTVRIANRQCSDGGWAYFYYDNNTATEADDELLLMIQANGQNIGNVDVAGVTVKMTTSGYGSNTGRTVTAPYASTGWLEANRTWNVTLPAGSQPTANVGIRFPFTDQDVLDIKGSNPTLTQASQLSVVAFKTQAAAANPATATTTAVQYYTVANNADNTHWKLGSEGSYNYAEFESTYGIYGGSIGFKTPVGINELYNKTQALVVYPNPVAHLLNITVPTGVTSAQQELSIFDQLGRVVLKKTYHAAAGSTIGINVAGLPSGLYQIRYTNNAAVFTAKFVRK